MGAAENKKLILAHYDAIWSGDEDALREQVADDFTDHATPPGTPPGVETVIAWGRVLRSAFPDMKVTMNHCAAEGDIVACHATWRGTHKGTFQGIAATGRPVEFSGMVFWRVNNGKIAERWAYLDNAQMMKQLQG
ncbi:MAG TPA: ester cyclase [Rhizomicrobium sp.]|jgi:steroid delta-isomerase-like uncharacterized protein|nr:ester cyclase [Rhizomicrobium sp.]